MRTRRREKSGLASYKATRDSHTGTSRSHALFRSRTSCSELMMSEAARYNSVRCFKVFHSEDDVLTLPLVH